ncbi:MAG: VWA domain-containing protein [Bacteroidales bacterium]|nr:VWA domain-containing protein [Bacteroidales bacterium]
MFKFEYPSILLLLLLIPIGAIVFAISQIKKRKKLNNTIDYKLQTEVLPLLSFGKQRLKFILTCIAFALLVLAAANPKVASGIDKQEKRGCDVVICLDISNSMLAQDLTPNRLERAKLAISQLISQMQDDRIGIVLFAGSSYTFLPLTADYATAKMFNDVIDTKLIDYQGTNIQQALETAGKSFGSEENKRSKAVILISDGEDNQPEAENIAKKLAKEGIIINCIGIGSQQGTTIPMKDNSGNETLKKDKDGNIVVTKLNEQTLKKIAGEGSGVYVHAGNESLGLRSVMQSIDKMDKKEYTAMAYRDFNTVFYLFAIGALVFLLIDFIIYNAKNKVINRKFFFGKE